VGNDHSVIIEWRNIKIGTWNFSNKSDVQVISFFSPLEHFVPQSVMSATGNSLIEGHLPHTHTHTLKMYSATASLLEISSTSGRPGSLIFSGVEAAAKEDILEIVLSSSVFSSVLCSL
jgi:hypothetical protein